MNTHDSSKPSRRLVRCGFWRAALLAAAVTLLSSAVSPSRLQSAEVPHHHPSQPAAPGKSGLTKAEEYDRLVEEKLKHTYPATATRMLAECGGIRDGICIDLGCGGGQLDLELAKRSRLKIHGLDIDPGMKPLFEKRIRAAGLEQRVSFVPGDAQKLPFPDAYADLIVSRGMLIFVPDIKQCLRETVRVLKPTGVAFLGGRYLFAPDESKLTIAALRKLVAESGVAGAEVIEDRGQWVKILGPQAPQAARESQLGPQMLAYRFVADYGITRGKCLLICRNHGPLEQAVQRGLADATELQIVALYPSDKLVGEAGAQIREAGLAGRITCQTGDVHALPFPEPAFAAVIGVAGVPFWKDREQAFRELHRVLLPGAVALAGGQYRFMPESKRLSIESLRQSAERSRVPSIRVYDDRGQWVEICK
jgi:ubiquinone/menaquinone biosynthesis C-methylase UbiE